MFGCSDKAFYGGKIQDTSIFVRDHKTCPHLPRYAVKGVHIQFHYFLKRFIIVAFCGEQTVDSGTVDQDIYGAKGLIHLIQHMISAVGTGDVTGERKEGPVELFGIVCSRGRFFRMVAAYSYLSTF